MASEQKTVRRTFTEQLGAFLERVGAGVKRAGSYDAGTREHGGGRDVSGA